MPVTFDLQYLNKGSSVWFDLHSDMDKVAADYWLDFYKRHSGATMRAIPHSPTRKRLYEPDDQDGV